MEFDQRKCSYLIADPKSVHQRCHYTKNATSTKTLVKTSYEVIVRKIDWLRNIMPGVLHKECYKYQDISENLIRCYCTKKIDWLRNIMPGVEKQDNRNALLITRQYSTKNSKTDSNIWDTVEEIHSINVRIWEQLEISTEKKKRNG